MSEGSSPRFRFVMLEAKSFAGAAREDAMAGKGKKSKQRKKLVKKRAKEVIKKAKKEENTEVDRSDVKPPSTLAYTYYEVMRTSQGRGTSPSCRNCCVRRLGNGVKPPPSFLAKLRAGIFWLWFQELDAADMLSCTPKNKSACASSNECECRIHRGSDRRAKSGVARK